MTASVRLGLPFFVCVLVALMGVAPAWAVAPAAQTAVKAVRVYGAPDSTRVVLELSGPADYRLFQLANPDRVVLDVEHGVLASGLDGAAGKGVVKDVRVGRYQDKARVVLDLAGAAHPQSFLLNPTGQYGYRLVVDLGTPAAGKPAAATRTAVSGAGDARARPVVIAVDPGHGGDDPGARGRNGTLEKNVTLEVGKDLAKLINAQPGMHAVLTRTGDYYVPLEKRFQIARADKADLFVSIHANSCPDYCSASGASVWVLSPRGKQSEAGRWLAQSENASDLIGGVSLDNKNQMLASVLLDLSQGASMHAAHEVGADVLTALGRIGPLYRNTVQGANFVVLRSPDVPSILVETAFISNRGDEQRLASSRDRQALARAILTGVKQYFVTTPPPGTWFAERRNHRLQLAAAPAKAAPRVAATAPATKAVADDRAQDLHRVSRGETLSGVARQYGVSAGALRETNPNKIPASGAVQAGEVLLIPSS
jgi:N-acetylmuramoyl-L-alanine amidase